MQSVSGGGSYDNQQGTHRRQKSILQYYYHYYRCYSNTSDCYLDAIRILDALLEFLVTPAEILCSC